MHMNRVISCTALLALWPAHAGAQSDDAARWCKNGALPFAATEANRLSDADIHKTLAGKRLVYVRETIKPPGQYINSYRELRSDGSVAHQCRNGPSAAGPWRPCGAIGSEKKSIAGARDVGVWSVNGRMLCTTPAAFGPRAEGCFAIHRQGQILAAKQMTGSRTYCIEGAITAE